MTRARDRLYVAGFHNGSLPEGCWYKTIQNALAPELVQSQDYAGRPVWRLGRAGGSVAREAVERPQGEETPAWCRTLPRGEAEVRILSPSKLAEAFGAGATAAPAGAGVDRRSAQLRGTLIHRLLEILPALPEESRSRAAEAISSAFAADLAADERTGAIAAVFALLSGDALNGPWQDGLSEAGLAVAEGRRVILGQADRVLLGKNKLKILDYKSGLPGPATPRRAHLAQLACYRLALARIYPAAEMSAALLGTRDAKILEAGDAALDTVLAEILAA
jgi:ATP-dependent helicase/nuclease subunit A